MNCSRCREAKPALERAPFPGAIGIRITSEICQECWAQWLKQQTMLINHYGLNVMEQPDGRKFEIRWIPGAPSGSNYEILCELRRQPV